MCAGIKVRDSLGPLYDRNGGRIERKERERGEEEEHKKKKRETETERDKKERRGRKQQRADSRADEKECVKIERVKLLKTPINLKVLGRKIN